MNNAYNEILEKLTEIIVEQLDVGYLERVTLDTNFSNDLLADNIDLVELFMAIEGTFDVEISDEECVKLTTVESVLDLLFNKIHKTTIKQIRATKIFKFLKSKDINQEILLKLLESDEITSNWQKISEFVKVVDQKSFTINEIAKYSFIFQNNFILSNVENIYKIVIFLDQNKISINQIVSSINNGEIESIKNKVEFLENSIHEKQREINDKQSEIKSLEKILQNLNEERQILQAELNEFLSVSAIVL